MNDIYVVMYHYVRNISNGRYNGIKGLEITDFELQIQYLKENFNIIKMEDVISAYKNGSTLPEKACLLTFDDGYIDHYTNAFPILNNHNVQGTFFVPARILDEKYILDVNKIHYILANGVIEDISKDLIIELDILVKEHKINRTSSDLYNELAVANRFDNKDTIFVKRVLQNAIDEDLRGIIVDKLFEKYVDVPNDVLFDELYMTKEQLKVMKDNGMHIGVHGYNHYWLGKSDYNLIESDIKKSVQTLSEYINTDEWVMNYPYGSYNDDTLKIVKNMGGIVGFSTEVRVANISNDNILTLPRFDTNDFPPKSEKFIGFIQTK